MDTLKKLHEKLVHKEVSSVELTKSYIEKIKKYDEKIQAFVTVTEDEALVQAKQVDDGKRAAPLAGIPAIIKDNIAVKDVRMTSSSKILEDYIAPYNATVIEKMQDFVLLGKGNLDAFGLGASTENSGYFVTKNPWDITKVAGGSSGGPAAAVAAGMAAFGIGTDTGGSLRQPSGLCGVVGLKPTYGRASRYGLAAMGSSLDCPGPIANSVEDAAYILSCIAGQDPRDQTTSDVVVQDYTAFKDVKGMKVGLPKEFVGGLLDEGLDGAVKELFMQTVKRLENLGVEIREVSLPTVVYALPVYYIITPSEISANMARYDGIRYGNTTLEPKDILDMYVTSRSVFEDEVKRRIFVGNYSLSSGYVDAYYHKAQAVREMIRSEMKKGFSDVDAIVMPTSPGLAFGIGEKANDPVSMYLEDIFTVTANIAGVPGISIPCGTARNLPVGFQLLGNYFDELGMLSLAYALQNDINFATHYQPDLTKI